MGFYILLVRSVVILLRFPYWRGVEIGRSFFIHAFISHECISLYCFAYDDHNVFFPSRCSVAIVLLSRTC